MKIEEKTYEATPAKTRNGAWGARIEFTDPRQFVDGWNAICDMGEKPIIHLTTKSGKSWTSLATGVDTVQPTYAVVRTTSKGYTGRQDNGCSCQPNNGPNCWNCW